MKYLKLFCQLTLIGVAIISMTGCASLFTPIGDNEYDCNRKENPKSPYCNSFKSVDEATSESIPPTRYDVNADIRAYDEMTGIAPTESPDGGDNTTHSERTSRDEPLKDIDDLVNSAKNKSKSAAMDNKKTLQEQPIEQLHPRKGTALPSGTPVRVAPTIQATWIKSFVDEDDSLIGEQTVYREITPSHWEGHEDTQGVTDNTTVSYSTKKRAYPHLKTQDLPVENTDVAQPQRTTKANDFSQPGTMSRGAGTDNAPSAMGANSLPQ